MEKEKPMDSEDAILSDDCNLTNDEAVSLFSSSLSKALEKQSSVIVNSISEQLTKSTQVRSVPHVAESKEFEFKHEGHKIQHSFNQERISKLSEIDQSFKDGEFTRGSDLIAEEKAALHQRNKILKIADRHGWDTVHEYLDDPLADNNEDATKLRSAVGRAARKRSYRSRPYEKRRGGSFSANDFFRGFSNANNSGFPKFGMGQGKQYYDQRFDATPFQFSKDRKCFLCRQTGHYVRDCPITKSLPSATLSTPCTDK